MKFYFQLLISAILAFHSENLFAQDASIIEKEVQLITYPYSDPDPVPQFGHIFPYFRYDGYSFIGAMHSWKVVELENNYIKIWVVPEIGGKIWGAIEKSTGKEFIYYNHVVKFRDVALRGPWTSGGIEMNFGVIGHSPTCSSPVDYTIRKNEDGSVSCFVGAIDLTSRTRWSVEINLPKDKAYFTTRSRWDNPTEQEQSYYHWMNTGIKVSGNLEYVFPGNHYLGHNGKHSPWPVDEKGREIKFYDNNNFGSYKSYHVFGEATGFYGAYWHDDDFGFVHYSSYDAKPGKKVWIWGLSGQGMIWEKLLTDSDGQYTELQSGRLFNQAEEGSSITPFKNRGFAAGLTDEWTEYWFPVKETQGLKSALPAGSVNIQQQGKTFKLWFCPNEKTNGKLEVRSGSEVIFTKEIQSEPMQVVTNTFDYKGNSKNLSVWLKNEMLFDSDREKYLIKRPVESPASFNWDTAYGHSLKGKEFERQRLYKIAGEEYRKALEIEPFFVPALTAMANLAYRKADYLSAMEYSLNALSVDTYDADANMIYGLAGLAIDDTTSAVDGFSIASVSVSHRSAAYNALSSISAGRHNYQKALDYAEKSLLFNQMGTDAIQLKCLCFRKLGMKIEASNEVTKLEENDPLNHFIRFERFLTNPSSENTSKVKDFIRCELPQETYLEYALWYFNNGQRLDALRILEFAPQAQPIVLLWEGFLNLLIGKKQEASDLLTKALVIDPQFVFPYRLETLKPLEWAQSLSDNWKIKYYTGLIYLNAGENEKGRSLWNSCGDQPDFYPFYIARSKLSEVQTEQALADVEKALKLERNNWRVGLFASKFYYDRSNNSKAEELAKTFYGKYPQNYYLGLQYAKLLELNRNYKACISLIKKIKVLPNEGATEGRAIWRYANVGNALDMMNSKSYLKSLESIDLARDWPVNLGVGKPSKVDERLEDFIALQCFKKLKNKDSVVKMMDKIAGISIPLDLSYDVNDFFTAWILKGTGNKSKADQIMKELLEKNSSSKLIHWCYSIYYNEKAQALTIASDISNNDLMFICLNRIFNEMDFLKLE